MKILIVNGYGKTSLGIQSFAEFQYFIQKTLKEQKELADTETEYFIRDKETLDDFLYELDSSYVKKDCAKLFDHLDMIFITGEPSLLPWNPTISKILILIRMCLRVKKFLFASSFAMQCLIFLSATNFEKNISICNGKGKGGKIGDFKSLDKELIQINQNDYFLDNITGDLYSFNYENEEWVAKANTGLHYQIAAESFQTIGRFIIKAPIYRPKSNTNSMRNLIISRNTEVIGYLKKTFLHHWALDELPLEFIVPFKCSWHIHPFSFINKTKKFETLAECEKGPLIIEFKNILCTQFEIEAKYAETRIPLKNFILRHLRLIKTYNKSSEGSILSYYKVTENIEEMHKVMDQLRNHERKIQKRTFKLFDDSKKRTLIDENIEMGRSKQFHHAGLAMKRHGEAFYVEQNAVAGDKSYKMKKSPRIEHKNSKAVFFIDSPKINQMYRDIVKNDNKNYKMRPMTSKDENFDSNENLPIKKSSDIRAYLHPRIKKEFIGEDYQWIPGIYSKNKELYQNKNIIRVKTAIQRKYSTNDEIPVNTIHSLFQNKEYGKKIDNSLKKPNLKLVVENIDNVFLNNYEQPLMISPLATYKFRNEDKEKWISSVFKF